MALLFIANVVPEPGQLALGLELVDLVIGDTPI
jgi:hypothetical protein